MVKHTRHGPYLRPHHYDDVPMLTYLLGAVQLQ